jgi:hypothetical protein
MKNYKRGFVIPLLIAIIAVIAIGTGIYFYQKNQSNSQVVINSNNNSVPVSSTSSETPSQSVTQTPNVPKNTGSGIQIAVAGMQQYTDSGFGFSFWYPSGWTVIQSSVQNQNKYLGGTVTKQFTVSEGSNVITIEEFYSPTFSITDSTGVGACPVCVTTHYYFDRGQHTWMVIYPDGTSSGLVAPGVPVPANVSFNTMGGLHMLAGSLRFGANTIIPLSASNFVIVSVNGKIATESNDPQALAKTIVALDPSVATPVNSVQQTQVIQAEAAAYR